MITTILTLKDKSKKGYLSNFAKKNNIIVSYIRDFGDTISFEIHGTPSNFIIFEQEINNINEKYHEYIEKYDNSFYMFIKRIFKKRKNN